MFPVMGERMSSGAGGTAKDERAERLSRRLRENLRRRKAQARARRAAGDAGPGDTGAPAEGDPGDKD